MKKNHESGRSLLEMLAVLAIIAIIVISSLFLFNNLYKYYQRKDTVKQMDTIVTHYRSDRLIRRKNGTIQLKDILPKARGDALTQANGDELKLQDEGGNAFVIIATINELSCRDVVEEGNYDGVSKDPATKDIYSPEEAKERTVLKAICDGAPAYFIYGRDRKTRCKYYKNGKCSNCPEGKVEDSKGECCTSLNCGTCGGCPAGKHCLDDKTCVECINNEDCSGKPDKKLMCDLSTHHCVQCIDVGEACPTAEPYSWPANHYCNSSHKCEKCGECKTWNGTNCIDNSETKDLNEACTNNCECKTPYTCKDGTCQLGDDDLCLTPLKDQNDSCADYLDEKYPNHCCKAGLKCSSENICVECETDTDCEEEEYCDTTTKTCKPRCKDADKTYDSTTKTCVCKTDSPTQGQACSTPNKCCAGELKCSAENICVECETDTDCEEEEYCDTTTKTCKPHCEDTDMTYDTESKACVCKADSPTQGQACSTPNKCCAGELKCSSENICVECETDTDCEGEEYCDTTTKTCTPRCGDTDMAYDTESKTCVCKADSPTENQACSTPNKCCAKGLVCNSENKCIKKTCPSDAPIGYDPETCECPEGYAPVELMTGKKECYPICKSGEENNNADIIFLVDNSKSETEQLEDTGKSILDIVSGAVTGTRVPKNIKYALYITGTGTQKLSFDSHGGSIKALYNYVLNTLDGEGMRSGFHLALDSIKKDICNKNQKLLLLMYTDGILDNGGDFDSGAATWNTVKNACANGSEMYIMTWKRDYTNNWSPTQQFNLGQTTQMNNAIREYFKKNYCVKAE